MLLPKRVTAITFLFCYMFISLPARAQYPNYLLELGSPSFTTAVPFPNGFVNLSNGNLHIEIPLVTVPQRGSRPVTTKMVYDSRIWQIRDNGSSRWWEASNAGNAVGW